MDGIRNIVPFLVFGCKIASVFVPSGWRANSSPAWFMDALDARQNIGINQRFVSGIAAQLGRNECAGAETQLILNGLQARITSHTGDCHLSKRV